jgi:phosphonate transport system substrate-binding protein
MRLGTLSWRAALGVTLALSAMFIASVPESLAAPANPRGGNPQSLVFVFQKQKDPAAIQQAADRVAVALGKRLGKPVEVIVPGDYAASVQALVSGRADIAYVSSLPFLLARRDGGARLLLAEQRIDARGKPRTDYDSVFVVRADSPLKSFADVKRQARNLRFAFTSATSTSGYVMPYARMVQEGLLKRAQKPEAAFKQVSYAGGYTQALEQVAASRADVAAVSDYTMEGPKADVYLSADKRAQLRILERTPGVPTHLVAARGTLDPKLRLQIAQALLDLSVKAPDLLSDVYGSSALVRVNDRAHVAQTVAAIRDTGLPIEGLSK